MSIYPFVCLSERNKRRIAERIFIKYDVGNFHQKLITQTNLWCVSACWRDRVGNPQSDAQPHRPWWRHHSAVQASDSRLKQRTSTPRKFWCRWHHSQRQILKSVENAMMVIVRHAYGFVTSYLCIIIYLSPCLFLSSCTLFILVMFAFFLYFCLNFLFYFNLLFGILSFNSTHRFHANVHRGNLVICK